MAFLEDCICDFVIVTLIVLFTSYILVTRNHNFFVKKNIPYLKPRLFFGSMAPAIFRLKSMPDLVNDIYKSLEGHRAGGYFEFTTPIILVRDPEIIKLLAVKDFDHFTDHTTAIPEEADPIFAANLFFRKGQKWKTMRDILTPAFTSSKMKSMYTLMSQCGKQLTNYLDEQLGKSGKEIVAVEMRNIYNRYANDVIGTCAFGINCNSLKDQGNEFFEAGKRISDFSGLRQLVFFAFMMCPKLMTLLGFRIIDKNTGGFLCEIVKESIRTRTRDNVVRPDMIQLLMQAREGENNNKFRGSPGNGQQILNDTDIAAQAIIFFIAGFDGASQILSFSSLLLAMHPEIQGKLRDEVDKALDANNGVISYETLQSMKYMDMVLSETLRLYPQPLLGRECTKPYVVPASDENPAVSFGRGDRVYIPTYGIHLDPKYHPDPHKFDPERFSDEMKRNMKPFTYMPFGLGPRACIGNRFVLMESKVALAALLSKFKFEITDRSPVPIKLSKKGLNVTVDGGFWIGIKFRDRIS